MPKTLQNKLHSRRGESLTEVLVAMLVIALSVLLLAVMVTVAGSINAQTRRRDEQFYADLTDAETFGNYNGAAPDSAARETVIITDVTETANPKLLASPDVTLHGSDRLLSYSVSTPAPGGGTGGSGG